MAKIKIRIARTNVSKNEIPLPGYATDGASGMDVRAVIDGTMTIKPNETALVPTGFTIEVPSGYEAQVRPRSGLAIKHGIGVLNSPGTIDSDYRGEVKVILTNFSGNDFIIHRGDRIAQLVIAPVIKVELVEVDTLEATDRGSGGFGSTGKG